MSPQSYGSGRVQGMPTASPWQRSNGVWHQSGTDWTRVEAEPVESNPDEGEPRTAISLTTPTSTPSAPAPAPSPPGPHGPGPHGTDPHGPAPYGTDPDVTRPDGAGSWQPPRAPKRLDLGSLPWRFVGVGVVTAVLIVAGVYLLVGGKAKPKHTPAPPAAIAADRIFAADPSAKVSGRTQTISAVTAVGSTVVAAGAETGGVYSRGQFFVSADGGRSWQLGRQRAANGANPPPGEYPQFVAGAPQSWAALGGTPAGVAAWTSRDGRTWTREPDSAAFQQPDTPTALTRTASGFVAVGSTTVNGGSQAVLWVSPDGRTWQRLGAAALNPPAGAVVTQISDVAADGNTVVLHGVLAVAKKRPAEAFWRSTDGGHTWAATVVRQAKGSGGDAVAVVATGSGFFTARDAKRTTGAKKHKKTVHDAVVFGSPDGASWAPIGQITLPDYGSLAGLTGSAGGLAALVSVTGAKTAVLTGTNGTSWQRAGDLPAAEQVAEAALTPVGVMVAGHLGNSGLLTVAGGADVNLGAVAAERTVDAVAGAPGGQVVAVGSTNGSAAAWSSPTGSSWTRATLPDTGTGRLTSVVHGPAGWLAVGQAGGQSLVLTSADGSTWQAVKITGSVASVATGPGGYVIVGSGPAGAAAWFSADLKSWASAVGAGKTDLTGAKAAMSAVTARAAGYVAVGSRGAVPAVWTSPDGLRWTLAKTPPAPAGTLTGLVANGAVLVAWGSTPTSSLVVRSTDGAVTWQPVSLPGLSAGNAVTAATVASGRFVLAGTVGSAGGSDVILWSSAGGATWQPSRVHGMGLDGPGVQQLTGLTFARNLLLAVGFTGNAQADESTLWWTSTPSGRE